MYAHTHTYTHTHTHTHIHTHTHTHTHTYTHTYIHTHTHIHTYTHTHTHIHTHTHTYTHTHTQHHLLPFVQFFLAWSRTCVLVVVIPGTCLWGSRSANTNGRRFLVPISQLSIFDFSKSTEIWPSL